MVQPVLKKYFEFRSVRHRRYLDISVAQLSPERIATQRDEIISEAYAENFVLQVKLYSTVYRTR